MDVVAKNQEQKVKIQRGTWKIQQSTANWLKKQILTAKVQSKNTRNDRDDLIGQKTQTPKIILLAKRHEPRKLSDWPVNANPEY